MEIDYKSEDVATATTNTLDWAFKLGYGDLKSARIAYRACTKKGLIGKDGWAESWMLWMDLRGLSEYADKFIEMGKNGETI